LCRSYFDEPGVQISPVLFNELHLFEKIVFMCPISTTGKGHISGNSVALEAVAILRGAETA